MAEEAELEYTLGILSPILCAILADDLIWIPPGWIECEETKRYGHCEAVDRSTGHHQDFFLLGYLFYFCVTNWIGK